MVAVAVGDEDDDRLISNLLGVDEPVGEHRVSGGDGTLRPKVVLG